LWLPQGGHKGRPLEFLHFVKQASVANLWHSQEWLCYLVAQALLPVPFASSENVETREGGHKGRPYSAIFHSFGAFPQVRRRSRKLVVTATNVIWTSLSLARHMAA
jgi:hypothetical protein